MSPEEQFAPVDLQPTTPATDGFADELFAPLDVRPSAGDFAEQLGAIADEDQIPPPVLPGTEPEPAPASPPAAPAVPEPEVVEYEDGSTLSTEKTPKGWRAILDSGSGNPEVFYGKTKEEMWTNVASAKMHATRHIRDLDRKIKLTARPEPPAPVTAKPTPQVRPLTADEIHEVKTQLTSDPSLALDTYFQKRTGLTIDQLVALANQGSRAGQELDAEATVRVFKAQHPEYLPVDQNYQTMLGWMAKYKLGRTLTDSNGQEIWQALFDQGAWTAENLGEAFGDLAQDGLLELDLAPDSGDEELPPVAPVQPAPAPTPPPQNPRIASSRVGQRAGLGIRQRETVQVPRVDATRPPSDEEFERMTDAEIAATFAAVRRHASQTRR